MSEESGRVAHVSVTIAGRAYRMACEPGDEARIGALADKVDKRIGELASAFGSMDELRLTVMAAFSIADDLAAAQQRVDALQDELAAQKALIDQQEARFAESIDALAERVEAVTADLTPAVQA